MRATYRPKLGQHFLTSEAFQRRVAEALPLGAGDLVIEVGPGRGAMTGLVAARAAQVVAVELDAALAESLRARFADRSRIEIIAADILDLDLAALCLRYSRERAFVFGNLPYYITSPILRHLTAAAGSIRGMAFVVQREVAERITARPGSRAYGYLSVMLQCLTKPRVAFSIPPGAFSPPPKVHSALITFEMIEGGEKRRQERGAFLEFARLAFARKRKTLANNLAAEFAPGRIDSAFQQLGLRAKVRAEELPVEELYRVFAAITGAEGRP